VSRLPHISGQEVVKALRKIGRDAHFLASHSAYAGSSIKLEAQETRGPGYSEDTTSAKNAPRDR